MKKILFFFIIIIFIILIFTNNSRYEVINKNIKSNNLDINYPYFTKYKINSYILNYINNLTEEESDKLIIDYDYNDNTNTLIFYKTTIKDNMISEKTMSFKISKYKFEKINLIEPTDYNFINNKFINDTDKIIAFTFDDGPNYNTSKVIDILNKYNVTATFFVIGKNIDGNEKIIEKMYKYNMEIANHTFSHLLLTKYKNDKIQEEIDKTNNLIFDIIGKYPILFRPSYGSVNNKIKEISNMPIIIWNIDTLDWKYRNSNKIANKIISKVKDGDIILMHDIYKSTLNSLDIVIPILQEEGYKIVSVSELFYYKNQELQKGYVYDHIK